jgi:hypothetical protein
MGAYLSAGYDSLMRNAVALDVGAARGMHFDLHTIVSDEIFTDTTFTDSPVRHDPLVIEKALSETLVERVETRARPPERFFLHMTRLRDTARLLVKADARSFTDDQVADLLRAIEALLVRACATDASPAELVAGLLNDGFTRSPDWTHTHAGWVSLLAVERAVTKATGLQAKALPQATGDGIAVHLPPSARSIGHKALHSRVVRVLPEHPAAIAPTAYVF